MRVLANPNSSCSIIYILAQSAYLDLSAFRTMQLLKTHPHTRLVYSCGFVNSAQMYCNLEFTKETRTLDLAFETKATRTICERMRRQQYNKSVTSVAEI